MSTVLKETQKEDVQLYANKCGTYIQVGKILYAPFGKIPAEKIKEMNVELVDPKSRIVIFDNTEDIEFLVEPSFKYYFNFSLYARENGHFVLKMTAPTSCDSSWMVSYRISSKTFYKILKNIFSNAVSIEKAKD